MRASATNRDREKFGSLIEKAIPYVRGKMAQMLRKHGESAIDDVIQNAAMKAWLYRAQFEGRAAFSTWFTRIAINEALMWLRKAKLTEMRNISIDDPLGNHDESMTLLSSLEETLADPYLDPEQQTLSKETRDHLVKALTELPMKNRRILLMRGFLGYSTIETSEATGICQSTIKARNRRAKTQVRDRLAEVYQQAGGVR